MKTITFQNNEDTKKFILDIFNKTSNEHGQILEKNTGKPVLSTDGLEISIDELGVIKKGSELFVKDDLASLFEFFDTHLKKPSEEENEPPR